MKKLLSYLFFILPLFIYGQEFRKYCNLHITDDFISLDKDHTVKIASGEVGTYHLTFYKDYMYRLAVCTDIQSSKLLIELFDHNGNLLYSNQNFSYSPTWDFMFRSTITCTIKVTVLKDTFKLGTINLAVGYKRI